MSHQKKPKPGDLVQVHWIDSGLYKPEAPKDTKPELHVSVLIGKVLSLGRSRALAEKVGKKLASKILVVVTDSAGPEDESHIHHVWWPSIAKLEILKRGSASQ